MPSRGTLTLTAGRLTDGMGLHDFFSTISVHFDLMRDFSKLCKVAGYTDRKVCFSMFGHRFITGEVRAHLRQWEAKNGALVIDQDYRALLERVRVKTGHASVESLWHYIDIARETEGLWVPIDDAIELDRAYRDIQSELRQVRRDLAGDKRPGS